jgi:hypothetical protein
LFTPTKPQQYSFQYTSYDSKVYFEGDESAKERRLFTSLAKADDLIGTIQRDDDNDNDDDVGVQAKNLSGYIQAIRLRLLLLVRQDSSDVLSKLKKGGAVLFNLLEEAYLNNRGVSIRYWLHLIDLCTWFDEEYKRTSKDFSTTDEVVECTLFSKKDAHIMIQAMEMVLQSYGQEITKNESVQVEKLRKKLLGLMTASIVQYNSLKSDEKSYSTMMMTNNDSNYSNYDILTANRYF